ncbi:MAG: MarR family winged helix-turn-helix transcriptional regulator [Bacteroidota bacterium]
MKRIDEELNAKFKSEHHQAVVNVRYTSNWIGAYHNRQLKLFDLTLPQFNIMRILRGAGKQLSIKVIKDRMLEKSPNTTRLIDKLIDKKFVKRMRCDEDRRVVYVAITKKGRSVLEEIDQVFDDIYNAQNFTLEEARQLNYLLDKMRDSNESPSR